MSGRREYIRRLIDGGLVLDKAAKADLALRLNCSVKTIDNEVYRINNPGYWNKYRDTHQVASENARAKRLGVAGHIQTKEWRALLAKYQHRCVACKTEAPLSMDHVVPFSKGGAHHIDNIQPLCAECNLRKSDQTIDYRK